MSAGGRVIEMHTLVGMSVTNAGGSVALCGCGWASAVCMPSSKRSKRARENAEMRAETEWSEHLKKEARR
jgi:hypothetical protein